MVWYGMVCANERLCQWEACPKIQRPAFSRWPAQSFGKHILRHLHTLRTSEQIVSNPIVSYTKHRILKELEWFCFWKIWKMFVRAYDRFKNLRVTLTMENHLLGLEA